MPRRAPAVLPAPLPAVLPGLPALLLAVLAACTPSGTTDTGTLLGPPPGSDESVSAPPSRDGTPGAVRLSQPRAVHRAVALTDGSVLLTGGCTAPGCGGFDDARVSEVIRPDGSLEQGPVAVAPRANGTATLLPDGRVLLTGGYPGEGEAPTPSVEVFDPERNSFDEATDLLHARADHTATLLPDGKVLLAGGFGPDGAALATTELFDPVAGETTPGPDLPGARAAQVAVRLGDSVLLAGGTRTGAALATTDVLTGGSWQPGPPLGTARVKAGIVPTGPRSALVVGGALTTEGHSMLSTTEVVHLDRGVAAGPDLARGAYKLDGAIALLADGRAVIPVGDGLEVYDPEENALDVLPGVRLAERLFRTITPVGPRTVLIAGGYDPDITPRADLHVVTVPAAT